MKNLKFLSILWVTFVMISCSSTMKYTWTKPDYTGKKYNNILVIGATKNLESRNTFESTVVNLLAESGINAKTSLDIFPPLKDAEQLAEDKIIEKIKSGNYDAVIVASLIDVNTQDVRESGNYYGGAYMPMRYGYGTYIYSSYNFAYSPDYYRQQKTYVLESRLFDTNENTKEDALVWTGQSNVTDPTSYESASKQYAKTLVKSLLESKMLQ
jgi:hypothetical protein